MQVVEPSSAGQGGKAGKISSILRVPDTVVFLFGQPHEWYFTSKNGGPHKNKTTILRKKRVNLTVANIEEVFLTKSASRDVGEDDVVAYFISSKGDGTEQLASLDACNAVADDATSCNIEYLNKQALSKNCIPLVPRPFLLLIYHTLITLSRRGVSATRTKQQKWHPPTIHRTSWRRSSQLADSRHLDTHTLHSRTEANEARSARHSLCSL